MTLYEIGDRVRVVTLAQTGRVISVQTSTELDTLGTTDPLFYKFRTYVVKLDGGGTKIVQGKDLEPE
ncbi:MAG TPA: hypothetical protein VMT78_06655 [Terriglobia bacterium]|nr:hypothetical protein [Terriglobia bacterium]